MDGFPDTFEGLSRGQTRLDISIIERLGVFEPISFQCAGIRGSICHDELTAFGTGQRDIVHTLGVFIHCLGVFLHHDNGVIELKAFDAMDRRDDDIGLLGCIVDFLFGV